MDDVAAELPEFNAYLEKLPNDQRQALQRLRVTIKQAAPKASECISYQLPAFRNEGKLLVGLGATAKHCALYLMSSTVAESFQDELSAYNTSKGTIRFQPSKPLPVALVKKLVKARIKENQK